MQETSLTNPIAPMTLVSMKDVTNHKIKHYNLNINNCEW